VVLKKEADRTFSFTHV